MSDKSMNLPHVLPVGWSWSTFSTVATIASNLVSPKEWADQPHIAPNNIERDTGRLLPFRTVAEDSVMSPKHLFNPGQLLYSKIRPYLNKCVRISFQGLCSADMYPLDAHIQARYLHYYILSQQFVSAVTDAAGSRTVLPKTNQEQLSNVPVPVPPTSEQYRIAETLESYFTRLDDAVATLEQVERNLKRYRASVLKSAVEGRLVPTEAALAKQEGRAYEPASVLLERILTERRRRWAESGKKGKYEEPTPADTSNLPELPEGWCWATVEQLASPEPRSIQSGPFGSSLRHSEFVPEGKLVIGIDNVRDGYFSMGAEHRISHDKYRDLQKFAARPGDVLVTVMATIGRTCVVPDDLEPAIITKHVYRVSPDRKLVLPQFLHLCMWGGPVLREQMFGQVQGQTRPGLNGTIIKRLAIPVPPLDEQGRILGAADRLLSVGKATQAETAQTGRRLTRLRQSILKWAFEGKLADQDPNDEPASVLLERIKAERDTSKPAKKKSRE